MTNFSQHGLDRQGLSSLSHYSTLLSVYLTLSFEDKFWLVDSDVSLFHSSEWDSQGVTSTWYTVYRICLALFMSTGIALHFVSTLDTLGIKWFIYMTNQGGADSPQSGQ